VPHSIKPSTVPQKILTAVNIGKALENAEEIEK
jgi:hypothetical protein